MPRAGPSSSRLQRRKKPSIEEPIENEHKEVDGFLSTDSEEPDAPRVAQWVDEEDLEDEEFSTDSSGSDEESPDLGAIKRDLSKLPLGALVKARKLVEAASEHSDGDEDEDEDSSQESKVDDAPRGDGKITKWKERREIEHRSSKHAPMEITSKKPVTRRRQVVESHKVKPRDPRFSDLSGSLSAEKFRANYSFLSDLHREELSTLRQNLSRARKLLISSPAHLRAEREEEVNRLELAVKRTESTVNKEKREGAEQTALKKIQEEEKEKRKAGKQGWWLKDADKKAVKVRARMEAIAATGGKQAIKKAIEKKQKKVGQKEKKSRPFAPPGRASGSQKRRRDEGAGSERQGKRARVDR